MSEAIKQATTAAEDYAYSTPLDELDVSNPHLNIKRDIRWNNLRHTWQCGISQASS